MKGHQPHFPARLVLWPLDIRLDKSPVIFFERAYSQRSGRRTQAFNGVVKTQSIKKWRDWNFNNSCSKPEPLRSVVYQRNPAIWKPSYHVYKAVTVWGKKDNCHSDAWSEHNTRKPWHSALNLIIAIVNVIIRFLKRPSGCHIGRSC